MREAQTFVDLKFSTLCNYVHFSSFHANIVGVAFECADGCLTPSDTPLRWVEACEGSWSDFVTRFHVCPKCRSYNVTMLMLYPAVPNAKQYWFWDFSTYKPKD
jgi:hypothetical protein